MGTGTADEASTVSIRGLFAIACGGVLAMSLLITGRIDAAQTDTERQTNAQAVREFLSALPDSQRDAVLFQFASGERMKWHYVPMKRAGLALSDLTPAQRQLIGPLLRTALSEQGAKTAESIVEHESILREIERERGVSNWRRRDPDLYYTTIFGDPGKDASWGWRFEGHHLSINVTQAAGESQVATPLFMGANPARVPSGAHAGLRLLAAEEDTARALVTMLSEERRKVAIIAQRPFADIVTRNDPKVQSLAFEGLAAAEMTPAEQGLLRKLVGIYAGRMTTSVAQEQLERIEKAGFGELRFAWAGAIAPGEPHYYRIHGPTVLIEYDNTQNDANHVHSVWRDLERDFGGDLLREHYATHRH
jgi:hypothetical protein